MFVFICAHLLLLATLGGPDRLAAPDEAAHGVAVAGGDGLGAGAGSAGLQPHLAVDVVPANIGHWSLVSTVQSQITWSRSLRMLKFPLDT